MAKLKFWDNASVKEHRESIRKAVREGYLNLGYLVFRKDPVIGWYLWCKHKGDKQPVAYQYKRLSNQMEPKWVTVRSFRRRQKLGLPGPRKKPVKLVLRGADEYDEIMAAQELIG